MIVITGAAKFCRSTILTAVIVIALGFCKTYANADRVIMTPSGSTLAPAQVSGEYLYGLDHSIQRASFVSVAINNFEIEAMQLKEQGINRYGLSAQMGILPETFATPAVSFGVRDVLHSSAHDDLFGYADRSVYISANKTISQISNAPFLLHNLVVTGGIGTGEPHGLFGSVSADVKWGFRQTLEFDGKSTNYRLSRDFGGIARIEYVRLHGSNFIGAELRSPVHL